MTSTLSFICPRCGKRSFNPHDVSARYCGACHRFVDDQTLPVRPEDLALEVATKEPMQLTVQAVTVLQLTGLIQLALRHPHLASPDGSRLRQTAETFLAGVRAYFADCPATLDVVARGDDPGQDTHDDGDPDSR
jgi:hypothetical protein